MQNLTFVIFWAVVIFLFLIGEAVTTAFYLFWYAPAGIISLALAYFRVPLWIQFLSFALLANLFFFIHYKLVRGKESSTKLFVPTNADQYQGKTAVLVEQVKGQPLTWSVLVGRQSWLALFEASEFETSTQLQEGQEKEILRVEGNKLILKK